MKVLEVFRALGSLVKEEPMTFAGIDIVEVAPCYDIAETTSLAAVQIAHELLCLVATSRAAAEAARG